MVQTSLLKIIHSIQLAQSHPSKYKDEYHPLRKITETERHMLFTCIQKQNLWKAASKKYLSAQYFRIYLYLGYPSIASYIVMTSLQYMILLLHSSNLYENLSGNNSLSRLLSWMRLSSTKSRRNY